MKYHKNAEIAHEYAVSLPTVANWIKDTLSGKKHLELVHDKGKYFVAKTHENNRLLKSYAVAGFKYKPSNVRIAVEPSQDFLKYLSQKQLIDIRKTLTDKHRLDIKYSYIDGGALIWDMAYTHSQIGSFPKDHPMNTMNLTSLPRILDSIGDKKVNIIEIGSGNGKPVLDIIQELQKTDSINKYIVLDLSSEMNTLAISNISNKFTQIICTSYVLDIEHEGFEEITYELNQEDENTVNLVLMYGGTIGNIAEVQHALSNIERSMMVNDLLLIHNTYPNKSRYSDSKQMYESPTVDHFLFVAKSLGFQVSGNDLEYEFDEPTFTKRLFLVLPNDHTIHFNINDKVQSVDVPKNTRIEVWKHTMTNLNMIQSLTEPLDLGLVMFTTSRDDKFMMSLHKKKIGRNLG